MARISEFKDIREARLAEAKLNSEILGAWPDQTVARQLMYIGAALVGSSGVSATLAQVLLHASTLNAYLLSLFAGAGMFIGGLFLLWRDQSRRWSFFGNRMRVFNPHDRFWAVRP